NSWQTEVAYGGSVGGCSTGCANDHVNLKQLSSDGSGRIFAAIKTANRNTGQPFVVLIVRDNHAKWSAYPFGAVEDLHTRPMVMIDEEHRELFMFAVSPEVGGTIYYKKSPIDNISFETGLGTPFLQSSSDTDISNPTSTKQNVNTATGLVVLASANTNAYYWHNYLSLAQEPVPPPAAPSNLTVTSPVLNPDITLELAWTDNSTNESGFGIERRTGTGAYSQIATVGAGVTSYTDTGLTPGTPYTYRVRAWNAVGYSPYSDEMSETTAQTGPVRTFAPVADAYVDSSIPNTNNGTKKELLVDASPVQQAYLKFQLAGLTGNTVTSAKLRLYVTTNGNITGGPSGLVATSSASFAFSSNETGSSFDCSLDGAPFAACASPASYTGLAQGPHTFEVRAIDAVGNIDPTPAGVAWTIDTIQPATIIGSSPPPFTNSTAATFSFSSDEQNVTFACRLDAGPFAACASPVTYSSLADGVHTFQAQATYAAGNTDAGAPVVAWSVDTAPPETTIT